MGSANNFFRFSFLFITIVFFMASIILAGNNENNTKPNKDNIFDISVRNVNGKTVPLSNYKGKVLMIVNVASKCGNTPQYSGLEKIYEKYKSQGFEILAFPCNDFGGQEPGTNTQIHEFCTTKYGVTFTLFDKIKVLGPDKNPLYVKLINNDNTEKGDVKWNFEKFLISRDGDIVARFQNKTQPTSPEVIAAIERELKK